MTAAMKFKEACSSEGKLTNLDSILKNRDISLPTKVHTVKATVSPGVMYRCENWTIKKAEYQRTDAFERGAGEDSSDSLGRVKLRRSNQSILKETNPD